MITVVVTTRGRPRQVIGLIESARTLARDAEGVRFVIGCDSDDSTHAYLESRGYGMDATVHIDVGPRPACPTIVTNRAVSKALSFPEAPVDHYIVVLGDDGIIATPDWDWMIERYLEQIGVPALRIVALNDMANPGQPTLFALHRAWLYVDGDLFDERFPFWWADSAIGETYSFITGEVMPILAVTVAGKAGDWNPRLRRMKLWWKFYATTRQERLETAAQVRALLELPEPESLQRMIKLWEKRDAGGLPASEEIVRLIAASGRAVAPDENYLKAEAAAIAYLEQHGVLEFSGLQGVRAPWKALTS